MSDEEIVPAPSGEANPGTQDGVGERAEEGLGTDGVQRIEGDFGALEEVVGDASNAEPDED